MGYYTSAFIPGRKGLLFVQLFGHVSKGVPGLEVMSSQRSLRSFKEKLIYITKTQQAPLPLRRYVLCVESDLAAKDFLSLEDLRYLEVPLLLLFWAMAGIIPLRNLHQCLSCGKIQSSGEILVPSLEGVLFSDFLNRTAKDQQNFKIIFPKKFWPQNSVSCDYNLEEILNLKV